MSTNVSAPLPEIDWPEQAVIKVDAGDANAKVTSMTIHLTQDVPDDLVPAEPFTPLFVYGASS